MKHEYYDDETDIVNESILGTGLKYGRKSFEYIGSKIGKEARNKFFTNIGNKAKTAATQPIELTDEQLGKQIVKNKIKSGFNTLLRNQDKRTGEYKLSKGKLGTAVGAGVLLGTEPGRNLLGATAGGLKLANTTIKGLNDAGIKPATTALEKGTKAVADVSSKALETGRQAVSGATNLVKNTTPTQRLAAAGVAGAGALIAAKLISNANEKARWRDAGCDDLEDESKKIKCKEFVLRNKLKNLMSGYKECNDANNPEKCKSDLSRAIQDTKSKLEKYQ